MLYQNKLINSFTFYLLPVLIDELVRNISDVMELAPISDLVVSEFIAAKVVQKLAGYYKILQS